MNRVLIVVLGVVCMLFPVAYAEDLLPDLGFKEQAPADDNEVDANAIPGHIVFRFDTHIRNYGPGEFIIDVRGPVEEDGRQEVDHVIPQVGGGERRVDAGDMRFDTGVLMMESPGWVDYRIREIVDGNGVGPILREGGKPAANITSTALFSSGIPNAVQPGNPTQNGGLAPHGISVGWFDLYDKRLPLQWVDITGLIAGDYWLETAVDPGQNILEADETNNVTRVVVSLTHPQMPKQPGDANGDGATNSIDIQNVINGVLGFNILPVIGDLNGDGVIDSVDIQLTINAVLGV